MLCARTFYTLQRSELNRDDIIYEVIYEIDRKFQEHSEIATHTFKIYL